MCLPCTNNSPNASVDLDPRETAEWLEALDQIVEEAGSDRVNFLLDKLMERARDNGVDVPIRTTTDYVNTIPADREVPYPGDRALERRIKSLTRWNAMAMVSHQNKYDDGIGGHIATYASLATLLEVGFNHFFRGSYGDQPGDLIYFQGHASPGVYARAFLEGRLTEEHLNNFRHELREAPGLSSYPHPWLMKDFWQFPTVSMGLGPINAIYQARFMRYLENRGLIPATPAQSLGISGRWRNGRAGIDRRNRRRRARKARQSDLRRQLQSAAARRPGARQRQNHSGAGRPVPRRRAGMSSNAFGAAIGIRLLAKDTSGRLIQLMNECVDGEYQAFKAKGGALCPQGILRPLSGNREARRGYDR